MTKTFMIKDITIKQHARLEMEQKVGHQLATAGQRRVLQ
jgi:hypothetical protein